MQKKRIPKTWLITDTHFGHDKIIALAGRPNSFEYKIFHALKTNISPGDTLIHLGDFCIGKDEGWHDQFMKTLPAGVHKILVKGNHDHKSYNWYYEHGWDFVCQNFTAFYFRKRILFSHRPQPAGKWDINIHGHFHNGDHRSQEPELLKIMTPNHKLLAIEYTNYQPVVLENFINEKD